MKTKSQLSDDQTPLRAWSRKPMKSRLLTPLQQKMSVKVNILEGAAVGDFIGVFFKTKAQDQSSPLESKQFIRGGKRLTCYFTPQINFCLSKDM